jgi:hypothetical protein
MPISIAAKQNNRLDIFAEGPAYFPGSTQEDTSLRHLSHRYFNGSSWAAWEDLGGSLAFSGLSATSTTTTSLDIYAIWTDGQVYWLQFNSGWRSWQSLGAPPGGVVQRTPPTAWGHPGNFVTATIDPSGHAVVLAYNQTGELYKRVAPYNLGWTLIDNNHQTQPGSLTADHSTLFAAAISPEGITNNTMLRSTL